MSAVFQPNQAGADPHDEPSEQRVGRGSDSSASAHFFTTPEDIIADVAIVTGVTYGQIMGRCRRQQIVSARRCAIICVHDITGYSLNVISKIFGLDHRSATHHLKTRLSESEKQVIETVTEGLARVPQIDTTPTTPEAVALSRVSQLKPTLGRIVPMEVVAGGKEYYVVLTAKLVAPGNVGWVVTNVEPLSAVLLRRAM